MMHIRSMHDAAPGRITRLRLDGADEAAPADPVERAFESFVVMLWQMALAQDSVGGWARTCEHLYTVRLFLDRMRQSQLAEAATELMALAGCHAELGAALGTQVLAKRSAPEGRRTRPS